MSDPTLPLQLALVAWLKATGDLTDLTATRIYDEVPTRTTPSFPYVLLELGQVLPDKANCLDGTEIFCTVHFYSRTAGFAQVRAGGAAIIAALDDIAEASPTLSVSGYDVIVFELNRADYFTEPDGLTKHAAITFRALIQLAA